MTYSMAQAVDQLSDQGWNRNDVVQAFQFLFSERKLTETITHSMIYSVLQLLKNNGAPNRLHDAD